MSYLYKIILTFHIVSFISWMAGILYLIRLFAYHAEETENVVKERFTTMERKLALVIMLPAMLGTVLFGLILIGLNPSVLSAPWMHFKLLFVALLMGITHRTGRWRADLADNRSARSGKFFRTMNELPTLLMILIVFMVIVRPF